MVCNFLLRRTIGLVEYNYSYIPNYTDLIKSLLELLKHDREFIWIKLCESQFTLLKKKLVECPVLKYPNFKKPLFVHTNSSRFALGAQLCQVFEDRCHPIAYHSKMLNAAQQRYSTYERKALAIIVEACKVFRLFFVMKSLSSQTILYINGE